MSPLEFQIRLFTGSYLLSGALIWWDCRGRCCPRWPRPLYRNKWMVRGFRIRNTSLIPRGRNVVFMFRKKCRWNKAACTSMHEHKYDEETLQTANIDVMRDIKVIQSLDFLFWWNLVALKPIIIIIININDAASWPVFIGVYVSQFLENRS